MGTVVAAVRRGRETVKGIAARLSTEAGTEAWKQAEGIADKEAPERPRQGKTGKRGKEKAKAE